MVDMARFITGEEITEMSGAVEETFIKERDRLDEAGNRTGETGRSTVDESVAFIARLDGGAIATFEATRLPIGDRNLNRIEIHSEKGALRFDLERLNELLWFDNTADLPCRAGP